MVTGAGSGLGAAPADAGGGGRFNVALLDIDVDAAAATVGDDRRRGRRHDTSAHCDVGTLRRWSLRRSVRVTLGGCDILCSNVGVQQFGAIDKPYRADWQWILNVNVLGTVRTKQFPPTLRAGKGFRHRVHCAVERARRRCGSARTRPASSRSWASRVVAGRADGEDIGVTVLFGGMMTRHREQRGRDPRDLANRCSTWATSTRVAHQPMGDDDLATPEHAIRNLLDLEAGEHYVLTHGSTDRSTNSGARSTPLTHGAS